MRILLFIVLIGTFSVSFIPAHFLNSSISSIDDTSYISHSMTLGLDFDLNYTNEVAKKFNTNGNVPSHPYGFGLLAMPFVYVGGIIDSILENEVLNDRHKYFASWSFFGILFSVSFYFLLGSYFLLKTIYERYGHVKEINIILFLSLMSIISSGILYYVLGRFTMSHGMEFGIISMYIFLSHKLQTSNLLKLYDGKLLLFLFLISISLALIIMLRPANIFMIFLPIILSFSYFNVD